MNIAAGKPAFALEECHEETRLDVLVPLFGIVITGVYMTQRTNAQKDADAAKVMHSIEKIMLSTKVGKHA